MLSQQIQELRGNSVGGSYQRHTDRMQLSVILVVLLVLVDPLHGVPVLAEPLFPTQENFDLSKVRVSLLVIKVALSPFLVAFPRSLLCLSCFLSNILQLHSHDQLRV